jgi:hypothetical protein
MVALWPASVIGASRGVRMKRLVASRWLTVLVLTPVVGFLLMANLTFRERLIKSSGGMGWYYFDRQHEYGWPLVAYSCRTPAGLGGYVGENGEISNVRPINESEPGRTQCRLSIGLLIADLLISIVAVWVCYFVYSGCVVPRFKRLEREMTK